MHPIEKAVNDGYELVIQLQRFEKTRFLFSKLQEAMERQGITAIYGLRGAGKTVLLAQSVKNKDYVYIDLSDPSLMPFSLQDIIKYVEINYKPEVLVLDELQMKLEIHALRFFTDVGKMKIFVSGSSILSLLELQLDRRVELFYLPPLSLREYLLLKYNINENPLTLTQIINEDVSRYGIYDKYLPNYYSEALPYLIHSSNKKALIEAFLYKDLLGYKRFNLHQIQEISRLLFYLADAKAEISIRKASNKLGIAKTTLSRYLDLLTSTKLIIHISAYKKPYLKSTKVYFTLPIRSVLLTLMGKPVEQGLMLEEIFVNNVPDVKFLPGKGQADFVVDGKIVEIGSKAKKWQPADIRVVSGRFPKKSEKPLAAFCFLY